MNDAEYLFHQGTNFYSYKYLGATLTMREGKFVYTFRTWAPNAYSVSLASDFCGWSTPKEMKKVSSGVWETVIVSEVSLSGKHYKFKICGKNGIHLKGDPYATYSKGGADGASVIFHSEFEWNDSEWMEKQKRQRKEEAYLSRPINIYEMHPASFIKNEDKNYLTYRELARILPQYLRYMGYTHVEFMPISEHPFEGSWGYQVGAFYAPLSKFGTPDDFKFLINELHAFVSDEFIKLK